jgi:HAD superfamily hydrolase (TIGR01458 family)
MTTQQQALIRNTQSYVRRIVAAFTSAMCSRPEAASATRLCAEWPDMHTIGHQLIAISPDTYRRVSARLSEALHAVGWMAIPGTARATVAQAVCIVALGPDHLLLPHVGCLADLNREPFDRRVGRPSAADLAWWQWPGMLGWCDEYGYGQRMRRIRAVLIDIDGVLTLSWKPLPGAVAALHRLRAAAVPLALVTNTTSRTRASIASVLAEAGFPVTASDVLTAPVIAAAYLQDRYPGARCMLLNSGDIAEDLAGLTLARPGDAAPVDVVLVGGAGPEFSYQALNQAFGHLQRGARLVAMHRGLYWRTSEGLQLDTGAFIAGLEQAAGTEADVVGKPAAAFFAAALAHLGADAAHTLMAGDDIETDVLAAQRQGLTGALVKTGKYLPRTHRAASGTPDHVLDSFAGLPALLEQPS